LAAGQLVTRSGSSREDPARICTGEILRQLDQHPGATAWKASSNRQAAAVFMAKPETLCATV
jgi:hypothetical protein